MDASPSTSESVEISHKRKADEMENDLEVVSNQQESSEKPNIIPDENQNLKVLKALMAGYAVLKEKALSKLANIPEYKFNLTVSVGISNLMMNLHTFHSNDFLDHEDPEVVLNFEKRNEVIKYKGDLCISYKDANKLWLDTLASEGLSYYSYKPKWTKLMDNYLACSVGFEMRIKELKRGYSHWVEEDIDDGKRWLPISALGLKEDHHVLLEGITYVPDIQPLLSRSLGPITVLIQMLLNPSSDIWEDEVFTKLIKIDCIDDIIRASRNHNPITDFKIVIQLIAEILMRTQKYETHMFVPIAMLYETWKEIPNENERENYLSRFSDSIHGRYNVYQRATFQEWYIAGSFPARELGQIVFHSIFGTYKDLGLLEQITTEKNWYTKQELKHVIKKQKDLKLECNILLPKLVKYSECPPPSCHGKKRPQLFNKQITSCSVFAGKRIQHYSEDLLEYLEELRLIRNINISDLEAKLRVQLQEIEEQCPFADKWKEVKWFNAETVEINDSNTGKGLDLEFKPITRNKSFMA